MTESSLCVVSLKQMTLNEIRDFDRNEQILFNFDIRRVYVTNLNVNSEIMNNHK